MNILFVLYRDFLANSANPLALYARELHLSGHACAVAVPENLETISQHDNVTFRPVLYSDVLTAPASVFPDGRPADVIHACTPREVVRKFVTSYMAKQPTALVIYLEDNEEWISTRALGLTQATLYQQTERAISERLPDSLSHPFLYESFIGLADAVAVIQDKLCAFVPPWVYCITVMIGADIELFSPRPPSSSVRTRYSVSENDKVIVYHGSLNQFNRAAIRSLCVAVGLIRQRGFQCRLLRTGAYALDFLEELPRDTALAISDLGLLPRSALPDLLALADVFVQPGTPEPFEDLRLPGKIAEFLAMGRPVIMPNANIAGLFKDGVDAVLLHTGTPDEIASRCIELFSDPKRAAEIGRAGRLVAEKHFDVRVQARLLEDTYKAALKSFDPVIARDVWKAGHPGERVALLLARRLNLLAERYDTRADAALLKEHARYIELAQHRIAGLDATLTERDQEIAALKQALSERQRIPIWRLASDRVKVKLNRLRTGRRRRPNDSDVDRQPASSGFSLPLRQNTVLRFLPLILLPFLLTAIDDSWTFLAPTGFIDSYVYTGYFLDVGNHLRTFAHTYYSTRLPWILIGSLAYTVAPVELANLFLRFGLFYLGTFSLYVAVRTIWKNHSAALVSAILLGVHTHFLNAIHWDYVDGPAITTLLVSLACLARSPYVRRPGPLLIASGFAAAVALSIHLFIILLFPGLGLWYAWTHSDTSRGRFCKDILLVCGGAVLAFLLFGSISKGFGSDFNYLQPQIDVARTGDTSPWRQSNREWIEFANWLAFPTIAVLFSAAVVVGAGIRRLRKMLTDPGVEMLTLAGLMMILTAVLFLFVELNRGLALQERFYASFLIPYTFLMLGGGISVSMSRSGADGWVKTAIVTAAIILSVGSFVAASFRSLPGCSPTCSFSGTMALVLIGAVAAVGLSIMSRSVVAVILTITLMVIVNAAPNESLFVRQQRDTMHDRFLMVYDANAALEPYNRDGELRFWYNRGESLGPTFVGIASLQLWGYRLISDSFPSLTYPLSGTETPVEGRTIALLTQDDDALEKADDTLKLKGQSAKLLFRDRVRRANQALNVFVIKAIPSGPRIESAMPTRRSTDLNPMKFESVAGTVASSRDGSIRIVGAPISWAYAAILHLPTRLTELNGISPVYLHVRLTVSGESVGVGVLTNDGRDFIDQQEVPPTGVTRDIYLRLPSLDRGHDLVIRTLSRPHPSDVLIESVSLLRSKPD